MPRDMGYYIRILGVRDVAVPLEAFRQALESKSLSAKLSADEEEDSRWSQLIVEHVDGDTITSIERNPVVAGGLGADELSEFLDEVRDGQPASAANWLTEYLPRIEVIIALQILSGAHKGDGWKVVHTLQGVIWGIVGGILQADGEGFSNEEGYHILWQFSDTVKGPWNMAVLGDDGRWTKFRMDLGNHAQRTAFRAGKVPTGVKLIP